MVFFDLADTLPLSPTDLVNRIKPDYGLHLGGYHHRTLRAITH